MLKRTLALAGALLFFAAAPASANMIKANTTYDWTLGGTIDGSGTLTTGNAAAGGFDILSFTGNIGGTPIGGLLGGQPHGQATSPLDAFYYDNLIFANNPNFDIDGVLFQVAAGLEGNIWGDGTESYSYYSGIGGGSYPTAVDRSETFAVSAVPEPITLSIFGVGLLGAGVAGRRKKSATLRNCPLRKKEDGGHRAAVSALMKRATELQEAGRLSGRRLGHSRWWRHCGQSC